MNIQIDQLQKEDIPAVLPRLFQILYENMNPISPVEEPYDAAGLSWQSLIAGALEDPRRTLLIVRDCDEIVGFFMYATNGVNFLMEEIQLIDRVQGKGIFQAIYAEVLPHLPDTVATVEAYAHKKNLRSQGILSHLGLSVIGENNNGLSWKYRGEFVQMKKRLLENEKEKCR